MELEKQVCSLESAKRLRELGVKQESFFTWCYKPDDQKLVPVVEFGKPMGRKLICSAFTVAELGELLPYGYPTGKDKDGIIFTCTNMMGVNQYANTEAEARAKMLIYLKENNLI